MGYVSSIIIIIFLPSTFYSTLHLHLIRSISSNTPLTSRTLGILSIIRWISAIERSEPTSRFLQTIERIQALSMLSFYTLENFSFFTSPSAPVLSKHFSPSITGKASLWSIRVWAVYTVLQLVHLRVDWKGLKKKERVLEKSAVGEETDVDVIALKKQKTAIVMSAIENLAYLPLTIHW